MKKVLKKSKYILKMPLRGKGNLGDIINVKPGYGRYLEKYDRADRVTDDVIKDLEAKKIEWQQKEKMNMVAADLLFEELKKFSCVEIFRKIAQEDHLYSSINKSEVVDFFKAKNILIEKHNVVMSNNIKKLGEYSIIINVYGDKDYEITLKILKENDDLIHN